MDNELISFLDKCSNEYNWKSTGFCNCFRMEFNVNTYKPIYGFNLWGVGLMKELMGTTGDKVHFIKFSNYIFDIIGEDFNPSIYQHPCDIDISLQYTSPKGLFVNSKRYINDFNGKIVI